MSSTQRPEKTSIRLDDLTSGKGLMSTTQFSILIGVLLGLAVMGATGGILALIVVALFGAIGFFVGQVIDGRLDLQELVGRATDRR